MIYYRSLVSSLDGHIGPMVLLALESPFHTVMGATVRIISDLASPRQNVVI